MKNDSNTQSSKSPTHIAYHVRETGEGQSKKGFWTRVGAMWPNADGKGFNLQLDVVPLDGRVTLRVPEEKKD